MTSIRARVIRSSPTGVEVALDGTVDCKPCASGVGCGAALFARRRTVSLAPVAQTRQLKPGCEITLTCAPAALLKSALLGYGLPLLCMLSAASAASLAGLGDAPVAVLAVVGVGAGIAGARALAARSAPQLRVA